MKDLNKREKIVSRCIKMFLNEKFFFRQFNKIFDE